MASLHQRAKDIFLAALERPTGERAAFLAEACAGDEVLHQEAESLLAFHDADEPDAQAERQPPRFAPGEVFAGRYRMLVLLGRGGMGDVWRAEDLVLKMAVAIKIIHSPAPKDRERMLNEVRIARRITHPAICRVFDVGETDRGLFYSMELVDGEDLASFLRRVGRLPSEKVVDIARQLCGGLAAAHAQGVLHRDLKPANVLIDDSGRVRITDFGIAITRAGAQDHTIAGTPAYMAPEQRMAGAVLSESTDIYALGRVLYDLLVGPHVLRTDDPAFQPPRLSALVPDVHPQLERIVMQALSTDPRARPPSAAEVAARLPELTTRPDTGRLAPLEPPRWRPPWWTAAAAVVALAAGLIAAFSLLGAPAQTLTEQDTIVLADFENATGEEIFDGALKVALAVALEQSPFLKVVPDDRVRETLRLMQRPPDTRITRDVAREVARREHLKALLAGSISRLGRTYVLALEAVNAENGDVMAREQAEAEAQEAVLAVLGGIAARLREKLGESLASVRRFDVPLARATTPSLEALHAYSLALSNGREVPRLEAIPHLRRAIELDPDFAVAHALLSEVYVNTGQSALAPPHARRAFELRDRVSERERFFLSWRYYRDAVQAWDKALDLARLWASTYPREPFAHNSVGIGFLRLGEFEQALQPFREAIRLDPAFSPPYANLAATLIALGRPGEARQILTDAERLNLDFAGARRLSYLLAFMEGDSATMERELKASVGVRSTNAAFGWQARASAFAGRLRAAHEQFRLGIQLAEQGAFSEVAAQLTMEDAETHAVAGLCADARREIGPGLMLSRDNITLERASRVLALCGDTGEASALADELIRRFPEAILTSGLHVPVTRALVALQRGDAARAIALLDGVRRFDRAPTGEFWPLYARGLVYLRLKDGAKAAAEFQRIIDHRGDVPASMLYPLAHLGLARALAETDQAAARAAYDQFLTLWAEADPDLPLLREALGELGGGH